MIFDQDSPSPQHVSYFFPNANHPFVIMKCPICLRDFGKAGLQNHFRQAHPNSPFILNEVSVPSARTSQNDAPPQHILLPQHNPQPADPPHHHKEQPTRRSTRIVSNQSSSHSELAISAPRPFLDEHGNEFSVIDGDHTLFPSHDDADNEDNEDDDNGDGSRMHLANPLPHTELLDIDPEEDLPFEFRTDDIAYFTPFNSDEQFQLQLCHLLSKTGARLSLHDSIIDLIEGSKAFSRNTKQPLRRRRAFMKHLHQRFTTPKPTSTVISLEGISPSNLEYNRGSREEVVVFHYDFLEQVDSLLYSQLFGDLDNFHGCINPEPEDHWKPYSGNQDGHHYDELHDGNYYKRTVQQIKECFPEIGDNFVVALVLIYFDKTGEDKYHRYSMEPGMMTISLFNRKCRNKESSWRHLGFIPNLDAKSSAEKERSRSGKLGKGRSCRNYHKCLSVLLGSVIGNQGFTKPLYRDIRFGHRVKRNVRLFLPFAIVAGDGLSGDMICGRQQSYKSDRVSRRCDTKFEDLSNFQRQCNFLSYPQIHERCTRALKLMGLRQWEDSDLDRPINDRVRVAELNPILEYLDGKSQHVVDNAFMAVWLGGNPLGILGACPTDLMHAFCLGFLKYCLKIFTRSLTPTERSEFDKLADEMLVPARSRERKNFPRMNFTKGWTNMTQVTADEWPGVAFTVALIAISNKGSELVMRAAKRKFPDFSSVDDQAFVQNEQTFTREFQRAQEEEEHHEPHGETEAGQAGERTDALQEPGLQEEEEIEPDHPVGPTSLVNAMEMMLSFHAWYKRGAPFDLSTEEKQCNISLAIRSLYRVITRTFPRKAGNGWNLQKVHDPMHVVSEIMEFGSPMNYDCGCPESGLKSWALLHARTSQNRGQTAFLKQVTTRISDTDSLRNAMSRLGLDHASTDKNDASSEESLSSDGATDEDDKVGDDDNDVVAINYFQGSSSFRIYLGDSEGIPLVGWRGNRPVQGNREVHPSIANYLRQCYRHHNVREGYLICYTQYLYRKRTFKAHPNYRSEGWWYDWVMVHQSREVYRPSKRSRHQEPSTPTPNSRIAIDESGDPDTTNGIYGKDFRPAKILAFFNCPIQDRVMVLVHGTKHSNHQLDTNLFERWEKDTKNCTQHSSAGMKFPKYKVVPVEYLGDSVLVIEDQPGLREIYNPRQDCLKVTMARDRDRFWAGFFV